MFHEILLHGAMLKHSKLTPSIYQAKQFWTVRNLMCCIPVILEWVLHDRWSLISLTLFIPSDKSTSCVMESSGTRPSILERNRSIKSIQIEWFSRIISAIFWRVRLSCDGDKIDVEWIFVAGLTVGAIHDSVFWMSVIFSLIVVNSCSTLVTVFAGDPSRMSR